jgi:hypothetical protein
MGAEGVVLPGSAVGQVLTLTRHAMKRLVALRGRTLTPSATALAVMAAAIALVLVAGRSSPPAVP